jgi:hypothetical protein
MTYIFAMRKTDKKSQQNTENPSLGSFASYTTPQKIPPEEKIFVSGYLKKNIAIYGYFPRDVKKRKKENIFTNKLLHDFLFGRYVISV